MDTLKMTNETYDASSIKILSAQEAGSRFMYERALMLSRQYPHLSHDRITMGLEAAQMSGAGEQYFIDRYLENLGGVPESLEFTQCYREMIFPRG